MYTLLNKKNNIEGFCCNNVYKSHLNKLISPKMFHEHPKHCKVINFNVDFHKTYLVPCRNLSSVYYLAEAPRYAVCIALGFSLRNQVFKIENDLLVKNTFTLYSPNKTF